MNTVMIAAANSTSGSKQSADYVCDGTDDQSEINAAISTLPTGGLVALAEGRFVLSAPVGLRSNVALVGAGAGATCLFIGDGANVTALLAPVDNADHITIANLSINGNLESNDQGNGIVAEIPIGMTIRDVLIRGVCEKAMYLYHPSRALIDGCTVQDCGKDLSTPIDNGGIVLEQANDARVTGCHIEGVGGCGVHLRGEGGDNITISNNSLRGCAFIGIALCSNRRITVQGNVVEGCHDNGIDSGNSTDVAITGNVVTSCGQGVVGDGGHWVTVVANAVSLTRGTDLAGLGNGIHYANSIRPSKGLIVQGNVIRDTRGHGIAFDNVQEGVISGNVIQAADADSIWLGSTAGDGSIRNVVIGNNCQGCGIRITNPDNVILGNIVDEQQLASKPTDFFTVAPIGAGEVSHAVYG